MRRVYFFSLLILLSLLVIPQQASSQDIIHQPAVNNKVSLHDENGNWNVAFMISTYQNNTRNDSLMFIVNVTKTQADAVNLVFVSLSFDFINGSTIVLGSLSLSDRLVFNDMEGSVIFYFPSPFTARITVNASISFTNPLTNIVYTKNQTETLDLVKHSYFEGLSISTKIVGLVNPQINAIDAYDYYWNLTTQIPYPYMTLTHEGEPKCRLQTDIFYYDNISKTIQKHLITTSSWNDVISREFSIKFLFVPPKTSSYLMRTTFFIGSLAVIQNDKIYNYNKSVIYSNLPINFEEHAFDTDNDGLNDTVSFSFEINSFISPSNHMYAVVKVYRLNPITTQYEFKRTINSQLLVTPWSLPIQGIVEGERNIINTVFNADLQGEYLFNVSLFTEDYHVKLFSKLVNHTLSAITKPIRQLSSSLKASLNHAYNDPLKEKRDQLVLSFFVNGTTTGGSSFDFRVVYDVSYMRNDSVSDNTYHFFISAGKDLSYTFNDNVFEISDTFEFPSRLSAFYKFNVHFLIDGVEYLSFEFVQYLEKRTNYIVVYKSDYDITTIAYDNSTIITFTFDFIFDGYMPPDTLTIEVLVFKLDKGVGQFIIVNNYRVDYMLTDYSFNKQLSHTLSVNGTYYLHLEFFIDGVTCYTLNTNHIVFDRELPSSSTSVSSNFISVYMPFMLTPVLSIPALALVIYRRKRKY